MICAISQLVNITENAADLSANEHVELYNKEMSVIRCRCKCGLLTPWFDAEC